MAAAVASFSLQGKSIGVISYNLTIDARSRQPRGQSSLFTLAFLLGDPKGPRKTRGQFLVSTTPVTFPMRRLMMRKVRTTGDGNGGDILKRGRSIVLITPERDISAAV
jgi:hypothetical protein